MQDAPTRVFQIKAPVDAKTGKITGSGKEGATISGKAQWGVDGDSIIIDYQASPDPASPIKPSKRVLRAMREGSARGGEAVSERFHPAHTRINLSHMGECV